MSYRLEVAFNLKKTSGALELKSELIEIAKSYGCELSYSDFEFEGKNRRVIRNHIFIILFFPADPKYIIKFLTFLRKDRRVYVESIGFDDFIFKLLYASRTYLNKMDKYKAKEYLSNRKCIEDEGFMKVIRAI
jgi:hypothetical protein